MLAMRSPETPFLDSVERRGPGSSLRAYVTRTLPHSSTIVVANRAPHEPRSEGGFTRGAGGVITALLTLAEVAAADWVACARTDGERALIDEHGTTWKAPLLRSETRLHYATPTPEQYEQYYSVIANPVLWFVQHYLWDLANQPVINGRIHRAWKNGYVEVNKQVARKVVEVARGLPARPLVMVHDYQLYLVPKLIREQLHGATIQHFVHIPWPTPQYWKVLPREMRDAILYGLLGCDIVGFQTSLDVRNFLMTCEENAGLAVDEREKAVLVDGRVVYARAYPISIDVAGTTRLSYSHGVMVEERKLRDWRPEHLIVRIDRTDPSKNIVRGFLAYEKLLAHHPELRGRVQFWAFLQPSRQDVAVYRDYLRLIRSTAHRINRRYGGGGWSPIRLDFGESVRKAMAALRNFDVLLVNPVYDGLNLVSKEGALVNRNNGLIIQSCWIPAPLNPFQPNNSLSYARLPGLPGSGQYLITDNDELFNGSPLLVIDTADCHNGRPVTPVAQYPKLRGMTGIDFEWMGLIYTEVFQFWNGGDQPFADNTYLGLNGTTYMEDISVCGFRAKFGGGGNDGCPYP